MKLSPKVPRFRFRRTDRKRQHYTRTRNLATYTARQDKAARKREL